MRATDCPHCPASTVFARLCAHWWLRGWGAADRAAREAVPERTSAFRVLGTIDRVYYEVDVTGDVADPVVGSKRVRGLFRQEERRIVLVTPVGPSYTVARDDPASILAMLVAKTRVTRVSDNAPRLIDSLPPGAVW
ncbi:MAG: hypothetical protein QM572_15705 [Nocardioides sp.]|uniref:hypothetical protein n=1 Tax=Nocardioides sp. TaxID=35761 RepID=UPI0039E31452